MNFIINNVNKTKVTFKYLITKSSQNVNGTLKLLAVQKNCVYAGGQLLATNYLFTHLTTLPKVPSPKLPIISSEVKGK